MKIIKLLGICILLFTFSSCTFPNITGGSAKIDWVDFVVINDINYSSLYYKESNLQSESIGNMIGEVKFNVSQNVHNPKYKVKNGDAAFLDKGTKLYEIKGYKPEFRIAVNINGIWKIYESDTNKKAKKGEDLLDIRGKVKYIGINSETDGKTELGAIQEKDRIEKMIEMVLDANVNQEAKDHDGQRYFISFHLNDSTDVTRCYWLESGELSRGILLSDDFRIEVQNALYKK